MRGLDYKWIEALDAVVKQRSFERAAEQLYISQSAVSQRIKQLEKWIAQPALVRENPPRPTPAGKKLLGLYRRVRLLEHELVPELMNEEGSQPLSISIATNADSLATWLLPALSDVMTSRQVELNLAIHGESRTIEKIKSGEVAGAISLESQAIPGCSADYLGRMDYVCVSSPDFHERYFSEGVNYVTLSKAPAVSYDQYDDLHKKFLHDHFNVPRDSVINHTVGSSEAFVRLALSGVAYCLIPRLQIIEELESGALIDITPGFLLSYRIYWHHWQLESGVLKEISQAILSYTHNHLPQ
ncbi:MULTISPECIES: LysR family transcriptional regulator ArgP [Vibrio]|jgi:LysR family transcriptional regulator (chromosome initiation inhibitor)|uniref:HTH-type transcriptional regulator ArgP n=3 Tax=Vibrio TaxID=662 RepID=A0A7Z1S324_9VIBR|nr:MULTISPECIES: LysR family transcriptional regulator ArgP [Vibrio]KNH14779.1 chromosome replication initiation inhibitor protein [Vibrio lentus]MBY7660801.1 LysR family transcriptional regulator ArgP [Vibrio atlanticus]ERM59840.1 Chromosome initiation inhibitor [Vibrio cyclitrophicus FF75]KAA8596697.1 Transcriptional regulator ArgP LysR family [Vibrio cyclitrophicus]MBE8605463.1 LysR family transcriptional regulator ArgP [Vibrio sp. OPT10]|tara:strand:+ start:1934 stop:2830 length:897 start_codon:yes stop_codon:yes gene_type:complete